jgi:RNA polymerase sigma factor (sigma-70 family)
VPEPTQPPRPPHQDPATWGRLIDTLDVSNVFVVLNAWLGPELRQQVPVEDVWQETLWCSWRDREQHTWTGLSTYRAWLLAIARNRIADAARRIGRQKRGGDRNTARFSELAAGDPISHMLPPQSTTPSRIAGHRERAIVMERALERLAPDLRSVVHLRLFEELPMRDVATVLGIPLSTAKERFVRGLEAYQQRLRLLLNPDSQAEPAGEGP